MLLILFGKAGVGKTFVGSYIQTHFDFFFWDADECLTQDMLNKIHAKKLFDDNDREIITKNIIQKIHSLKLIHKNIVVAQGLYKEKYRKKIARIFPDAKFIQLNATDDLLENQLVTRNSGIDLAYAKMVEKNFESIEDLNSILDNTLCHKTLSASLQKIIYLW